MAEIGIYPKSANYIAFHYPTISKGPQSSPSSGIVASERPIFFSVEEAVVVSGAVVASSVTASEVVEEEVCSSLSPPQEARERRVINANNKDNIFFIVHLLVKLNPAVFTAGSGLFD